MSPGTPVMVSATTWPIYGFDGLKLMTGAMAPLPTKRFFDVTDWAPSSLLVTVRVMVYQVSAVSYKPAKQDNHHSRPDRETLRSAIGS